MTLKFGYHLPERSCARSHQFCYRSVAQHLILFDVSYLCCTDLRGSQEAIRAGLAPLCNPKVGLTFASATFLDGQREGRVMVFIPVGLVNSLWRPIGLQASAQLRVESPSAPSSKNDSFAIAVIRTIQPSANPFRRVTVEFRIRPFTVPSDEFEGGQETNDER